ncbi:hypothetical protein D0B54_21355 [Solimonas sp. K1W22B-7]|nr:hypothetical protein D0B54_21355 [Solimonas sp. K1W22B-7]
MLLALATGAAAINAAEPAELRRGIAHEALFGIDMLGSKGIAVGAGGQILATADGGKTWSAEKAPAPLSLQDVATNGSRSIAVGQMGSILVREGASAWKAVKSGSEERLMSVDINLRGVAVAVGSFGTVLRSEDGGASWRNVAPDWASMFAADSAVLGDSFAPHMYGVKVLDNGTAIIAGELSLVLVSTSAEEPWMLTNRGSVAEGKVDPSLFGLDIRDDGLGLAVGQSGRILRTTDGGMNWSPVASGTQAILLDVLMGDSQKVIVTGMREMLSSSDGGERWSHVRGGNIATAWYSAAARRSGDFLVVGQAGTILSVPR